MSAWAWIVALGATGWRVDGTGAVADAEPPVSWSPEAAVRWTFPLPSWGNASPVRHGPWICVTSEPSDVLCVDADTGRLGWRASNDYAETLPAPERAAWQAEVSELVALETQLRADQAAYSARQRDARRGDADATAALGPLSARIEATRARLEAADLRRTRRPRSILGYATETPVSDGDALYVLTGNGVVSRFDGAGTRRWSRWLGDDLPREMRGFDTGTSASPLLVDGTLVTAWGHLRGLDPATGETRWVGPSYRDYGTPAVVRAGGEAWLALPDGALIRARDGKPGAANLGDLWFVGPHAQGDLLLYVGGRGVDENRARGHVPATAWTVTTSAGGVVTTPRWHVNVPTRGAYYTAPLVLDGLVYVVSDTGALDVLRLEDGAPVYHQELGPLVGGGTFYPSPVAAGHRVIASNDQGSALIIQPGPTFQLLGAGRLEPGRATPLPEGRRLYVRGDTRLWCLEQP